MSYEKGHLLRPSPEKDCERVWEPLLSGGCAACQVGLARQDKSMKSTARGTVVACDCLLLSNPKSQDPASHENKVC